VGAILGIAAFAGLIVLVLLGRGAMIRENDRRVDDWARAQRLTLLRVDREPLRMAQDRPVWRVRVKAETGETRDAILRAGWSIYDPVDVTWLPPGQSAFR